MDFSERRSPSRVLIVETDESNARLCRRALQSERIEAQWVGPKAVGERLTTWDPQLFLLGEELRGRTGVELCAELRKRTNAPIILVVTDDMISNQVRAFNAGADDVIVRPITPPLLLARVLAHMRRAYRYSVPPVHVHLPEGTRPPRAAAPSSGISIMRQCRECSHSAPMNEFEQLDEHGHVFCQCPMCGAAMPTPGGRP